ncbi:hypothetical protein N7523_000864 [Penicillium sp. IBT 18751x]|nr:hypothetical protein N7523_000864 [Penicillium sp. IBT 18751x]
MKSRLLVLAALAACANAAAIDLLSAIWSYGKGLSANLPIIPRVVAKVCSAGLGIRLGVPRMGSIV